MDAFLDNPKLVWEWYQHRRDVLRDTQPSAAHLALARWERVCPGFTLITQNVDGLHQKAGNSRVHELHGNLSLNRCVICGLELTDIEPVSAASVPTCQCGGQIRPGVVGFGEMLPEFELNAAMSAAETCQVFLSVGTSAQVYPAASLAHIALDNGAVVIEINPEETELTRHATLNLKGAAGEYLPDIVNRFESRQTVAEKN